MATDPQPHPGIRRREFVAFVAAIMAVNALGVDLMLPALPVIGRELGADHANDQQWIVTSYLFGFGLGQLAYGSLADRYGRKPVLIATLAGFVAASIFAAGASTFAALIGARVLQGLMSASTRVLSVAIVRDSYSGRRMARISSMATMVFFLVPILAPTLGAGLLAFGPWRFILRACRLCRVRARLGDVAAARDAAAGAATRPLDRDVVRSLRSDAY